MRYSVRSVWAIMNKVKKFWHLPAFTSFTQAVLKPGSGVKTGAQCVAWKLMEMQISEVKLLIFRIKT